ncbi:MAG: hypothetical protein SFU56_21225 [Capsulimonadales bacterium]|nr:hypothetical protein [Capsulimonadales bacterium]
MNAVPSSAVPSFLELCKSDVRRWIELWSPPVPTRRAKRWQAGLKLIFNYCGLRATLLYRLSHALHRARIPVLPGIVGRWNLMLFGLDIPASVPFGPGIYIPHPVGTVVMAKSVGANVTLISGITIGMRNELAFPVLGDRVFVGAGARILGKVVIGSDVNIGANAVVIKDVPDGETAVGVPATIRARRPAPTPDSTDTASIVHTNGAHPEPVAEHSAGAVV